MMQMVSGAETARVYGISQPTVSRIVAQVQDTCQLWYPRPWDSL